MPGRTSGDLDILSKSNRITLSRSLSSKATPLRTRACHDSRLGSYPVQSLYLCPTMFLGPPAPLLPLIVNLKQLINLKLIVNRFKN